MSRMRSAVTDHDSPLAAPGRGASLAVPNYQLERSVQSMLKVTILIRRLDLGGVQRQAAVLARGLSDLGCDVTVVTFYSGGMFYDGLRRDGIRVVSLDKTGRWDVVRFGWRLVRTLRVIAPNVIYSEMDVPNVLSIVVRPFIPPTTNVWTLQVSDMDIWAYGWLSAVFRVLERRLSRRPALIISNSLRGRCDAVRVGFPEERIVVVPNGIETDIFTIDPGAGGRFRAEIGVAPDERLIGLVGRLDPMKGHRTFLEAAALLLRADDALRFVCIGDMGIGYVDELKAMADALRIGERVLWLPTQEDIAAAYNALDVLCLASHYGEGLPNVVCEAMACGVPCVVTDVGDAASVVEGTGIVVPPAEPGSLTRAVASMLERAEHEREADKLARRERVVDRYSEPVMIRNTYEALVRANRRGIGDR